MPPSKSLDHIFAPGPEGFIGERLRVYAMAFSPAGRTERPWNGEMGEPDEHAESWKKAAHVMVRGLWSGDVTDHLAIWGVRPPSEWLAFEQATLHANPWRTFHELRLDARKMANPPAGQNLFEMLVLANQLNWLDTPLIQAFTGTVCVGSTAGGDFHHLSVYPNSPHGSGAMARHDLLVCDHDEHNFHPVTDSLSCLAYLCALCHAVDEGRVSDHCAMAGYRQLYGRVTHHFSIDRRDPAFVPRVAQDEGKVMFHRQRADWLVAFLCCDPFTAVSDLPGFFDTTCNGVISGKDLPGLIDDCRRSVPSVLYAMWRAYLFDEPELTQYLAVGRAHGARLARDAAALIDQLCAGRNQLGKIENMAERVDQFRALGLDPRQAAERAQTRAQQAAQSAQSAQDLLVQWREVAVGEPRDAFVWRHLDSPGFRETIWPQLLGGEPQSVVEAINWLMAPGGPHPNDDEAIPAHIQVARHAGAALQAVLLGCVLFPGMGALACAPMLQGAHVWDILLRLAEQGRLDARALPVLRQALANDDVERHSWKRSQVLRVLGALRDRGSVALLGGLLSRIPHEGDRGIALQFGSLVGEIAASLRLIGDPQGAVPLLRFAAASSPAMHEARAHSIFAMSVLTPEAGTAAVLDGARACAVESNNVETSAMALLAYGLIGRVRPAAEHRRLAAMLAATEVPTAAFVEVKLAQAVALRLLGHEPHGALEQMTRALTEPSWSLPQTILRRHWALQVQELVPVVGAEWLVTLFEEHNENLTARTLALLASLGWTGNPPRKLAWLETRGLSEPELVDALADPRVGSRHLAARALGGQPLTGHARRALEKALETLSAQAWLRTSDSLQPADEKIARETADALFSQPLSASTLGLFNQLLLHPNHELKAAILRHEVPSDRALSEGMRHVASEGVGWQAVKARAWLDRQR